MENLIGFKMTYDKPYLVAILNLDEFFIRWPQINSLFLLNQFCKSKS